MRSSLALASEQDPSILLCSLLRTLCQFARADFAAIALCDPEDPSTFYLRAAGKYDQILSYDLNITDEACQSVCPASVMLHAARTGKVGNLFCFH
jgi:GAF domain-containing protein